MLRTLLLFLTLAMEAPPGGLAQSPVGTIGGTVVRQGTAAPIANAQITLGSVPGGPRGGGQAALPTFNTISDNAGRFVFSAVPVGTFVVRAQLAGYFGLPVNGESPTSVTAPATVVAGQAAEVRITMVPGGSISGRVYDSAGVPLPDVPVQALRPSNPGIPVGPNIRTTDDRGEYRLFRLPPGEYYVAAVPQRPGPGGPGARPATTSRETIVSTLYPNATDVASAAPLVLRGGDELTGIDIRMVTATVARISGRIASTLPPGPVIRTQTNSFGVAGTARLSVPELTLVSRDSLAFSGSVGNSAAPKEDGSFELENVPPGAYELIARLPVAEGWGPLNPPGLTAASWAYGRTRVDVNGTNVDNVTVLVHQGVDLKGIVSVDGKPSPAAVRISLQPDETALRSGIFSEILGQVRNFQPVINPDGSFAIPVLPEAQYRFDVVVGAAPQQIRQRASASQESVRAPQEGLTPLPPTAYLVDIRHAGTSVYDNGLVVGRDPLGLVEVLVNTNGGSIGGLVVDSEQKPVAAATVVLAPPPNRRQNPALYKTVRTDAQGRFTLTALPPGSYTAFAWESAPALTNLSAATFGRIEDLGSPLTVTSGTRVNATIRVIGNTP